MNIEKQVISLDVTKRLQALGVEQNSHFAWDVIGGWAYRLTPASSRPDIGVVRYAAYTVSELIDLLGDNYSVLAVSPNGGYVAMARPWDNMSAEADTPANALGLLLERVLSEAKE